MRLVYDRDQSEVKTGDMVQLGCGVAEVHYFREPHKPGSSGKVTLKTGGTTREYYVGIIGATWIEREDQ